MRRKPKFPREAVRGLRFGAQAAKENIADHGCLLAERNARDLQINARRRDAEAFDKAYAKAYTAVYAKSCQGRYAKYPPAFPKRRR